MIAFPKAIRNLQQAVTSQHAAAIVAHFASRPGAYGASALYYRCMSAHPDRPPNEGWPDPSPEWNLAAEVRYKVREEAAARRENIPEEAIQRKTVRLLVERGLGQCLTPDERAVLARHPLFQESR